MSKQIKNTKTKNGKDNNLLSKAANRFVLSIATAKRSKQLKNGSVPLEDTKPGNPFVLTALKEIKNNKVVVKLEEKSEDTDL